MILGKFFMFWNDYPSFSSSNGGDPSQTRLGVTHNGKGTPLPN